MEIFGGATLARPTCQQLPSNYPGYEAYCPYTEDPGPEGEGSWTGPDMEEARRLVERSGTAGARVVLKFSPYVSCCLSDAQVDRLADHLIGLLQDLGYQASVEDANLEHFYHPPRKFQMALDAWITDFPAASNFISNRFVCDSTFPPLMGFCDPRIDGMIDRATAAQLDDPPAAGPLWTEVDREIVDQAPYLWLVNTTTVEFISERVGNYQYSQQWGSLLDQLWIR